MVQVGSAPSASEQLQRVRRWSVSKYKVPPPPSAHGHTHSCAHLAPPPQAARQALAERLGRGSRTVDPDLESRLDLLRLDRQRYEHVSQLAQTLANQLAEFTATQSSLGDAFAELGVKTPPLHVSHLRPRRGPPGGAGSPDLRLLQVEFGVNADAQRFLSKSGKTLSDAISTFTADVDTLVHRTMEDTMDKARQYQAARWVLPVSCQQGRG